MTDYLKMYLTLFNAITDALAQIEKQNYGDAKSRPSRPSPRLRLTTARP